MMNVVCIEEVTSQVNSNILMTFIALNAKLIEWIQELEVCVQHLEAHNRQLEQDYHIYSNGSSDNSSPLHLQCS